jgi:hypothetical protein
MNDQSRLKYIYNIYTIFYANLFLANGSRAYYLLVIGGYFLAPRLAPRAGGSHPASPRSSVPAHLTLFEYRSTSTEQLLQTTNPRLTTAMNMRSNTWYDRTLMYEIANNVKFYDGMETSS